MMTKIKKTIVVILFLGTAFDTYAQYSFRIVGTGSASGCTSTITNKLTVTLNGVSTSISNSSSFINGTVRSGNYSSAITGPITIKGEYSCACMGEPGCSGSGSATASDASYTIPIPTGPNLCEGVFNLPSASNSKYTVSAVLIIWKAVLETPVNISSNLAVCDGSGITLRSNDALLSYSWEVSKGSGAYSLLKTTSAAQTTITQTELASKFSNPSGLFNFRIRNPNCSDQALSNPISGIQFWAPRPNADVQFFSPSCNGGSDGRIRVNSISGYVSQYSITLAKQQPNGTYQSEGASIPVNTSTSFPVNIHDFGFAISAGNYRVLVANDLDPSNLGACAFSIDQTISDPPPFLISNSSVVQHISCNINDFGNHNDAVIELTLQNGSAPYSYQASTGGVFSAISPDNSSTLTPKFAGLGPSSYQFKATYQNASTGVTCESNVISGIFITQPTQLNFSASKIDNLCLGKNRGEIDATISGGNGGYTYAWSASGPYAPYSIPAVEDPTSLYAGNYSLTVTDSKGCSNAAPLNIVITEPSVSVVVNASIPSRALYGGFDMTCAQNDGIVELDVQNEALPVASYSWQLNGSPFTPSSFTYAEDLLPGNYQVTIIDANNCDATTSVTLNPHPGITANVAATSSYNGFNTKCPDSNEGAGEVTSVTNAFGGLSYAWFDGSTDQDIFDLLPGNYAVTVIDGNGCSDDATLTIVPPPPIQPGIQIVSDYNGEAISCPGANDGALEAFPTQGLAPYSYQWTHGPTTKAVNGLNDGTYSLTVTDDYGCAVSESFVLNEPATMQFLFTKTSYNGSDLTCHDSTDGEVQLNITNGVAPYTYLWGQGSTSATISGLPAGDYSVAVTDLNGCVQSAEVTIINPDLLAVDMQHPNDFNGFDITCNGLSDGSARAFLTGGTAPYTYSWSGGQSTETINGLVAGTYSVNAFDANNCAVNGAIEIMEPASLSVVPNVDVTVSCNGFSDAEVSLAGAGGAGVYSFSRDGIAYQASNLFTNLDAGTKDFYLRDGNGCVATVQETLLQPDPLAVTFQDITDATCNDPVGSALAVVTGGNGGYAYQWYDDLTDQPMNLGAKLENAIASIYRVEIIDVRNCQLSDLVAVSSIGGAEFDIQNIMPVTCFGYSDGSASINIISGITPLSFSWSNGQTTQDAADLLAGNYFATVTDGLGCRTIKPLQIVSPAPLATSFVKVLPNCVGDCDGSIEVSISGGTGSYNTDWTTLGQQTNLVSGLCAGQYDLTIVDANNCILQELVQLSDPEPLKINAIVNTPICLGRCDGSIEVVGQGGTGPYAFEWLNGPSSAMNSQLCPGDYQLTMTDAHGCTTDDTIELPEGMPLPVDLGTEATLCVGQVKTLDPGDNWVAVEWTSSIGFSSSSTVISIAEPGNYFFRGVDAIGCVGLDEFRLSTSLDLLTAEFLMASEAEVGDTLVAIDISWPLPERVEWIFPSSFTRLPSSNPDFLFAVVPEPGTYMIGMQSFLAECRDLQEKELVVRLREAAGDGGRLGYVEDLIKQFSVFPNPNDGHFDVSVLLSESKTIDLKIISFPRGIIESHLVLGESDFHQVNFELSQLSQGAYLVLLTTGEEQRVMRFIKTN